MLWPFLFLTVSSSFKTPSPILQLTARSISSISAAGHAPPTERIVLEGTPMTRPDGRPQRPLFSSGPCAKRPGWTLSLLENAALGRSHRSKPGKAKLAEVIDRSRKILGVPADYRIG